MEVVNPDPTNSTPINPQMQSVGSTPHGRISKKILIPLAIIVLIVLYVIGLTAYSAVSFKSEQPKIQQTITQFFSYAANNDTENAYMLTSKGFQKATTKESLATLLSNRTAFADVKDESITGFHYMLHFLNPSQAEFEYRGKLLYTDGDSADMAGKLVRENGQWKFYFFNVNPSQKRLNSVNPTFQ